MAKQIKGRLTVAGIVKRGKVEIQGDVTIPNGSLVDVVLVETPEETRLKTSARARQSNPKPLRFTFVGKKQFTDDPIVFVKRMAKSKVSNVRFEEYKATCHVIPSDLQSALAEYMLTFYPPPPKIAKLFRKVIRQRRTFELNAGTKKAEKLGVEIRILCEQVSVKETESGIELWYAAIPLVVGAVDTVASAISGLLEYGPLAELEISEAQKEIGATESKKIVAAALEKTEFETRAILFDQLKRAAVRSRRKNSSPAASQRMIRKELSEIAKRLDAAATRND